MIVKTRARDLQPGNVVIMPWGDNLDDRMTVARVLSVRSRRTLVLWTDETGSEFTPGTLVDVEISDVGRAVYGLRFGDGTWLAPSGYHTRSAARAWCGTAQDAQVLIDLGIPQGFAVIAELPIATEEPCNASKPDEFPQT